MLSLTGSFNYYFYSDEITFRYHHKGFREYIKSYLHRDSHNGDIYNFMSKDCTRLRLYLFHHGGAILTEKILQGSRFLTIVETCKLIKKVPLDFFRSFFDMIVEGRRDYDNMAQVLLCVIFFNPSQILLSL